MCKTLLTIVLFFSFSWIASAQFNKGDVLVGGQLSYYTNKITNATSPDQNVTGGYFAVSAGKAISSNAVLGVNFSYSPNTQSNYYSNSGPLDYKNNVYGVGVFYRVYKSLGKDFFVFGEAAVSYNGSTSSGKDNTGNKLLSGHSNGFSLSIAPGIAYRISKKFFLEASIPSLFYASYTNQKTTVDGANSTQDTFNVAASLTSNPLNDIAIGFRLVL